jgi:hypothetical protein
MKEILNQLEQLILSVDVKTRSLDRIWFSSYMLGCKVNVIVNSALLVKQFESNTDLIEKLSRIVKSIAGYSEGMKMDADVLVQDIEDCLAYLKI